MDVEIGQLLDNKYKIVRLLGEGGMGAVYEGENIRIRHRVAIKVLHPNVANDSGARERFEREAQAAGHIGSDHIVEVFDLGDLPSGARYMVMEFLAGEPLASRVASMGRIPPGAMAPLMLQLLDGLGAAHVAGIVHRDLKPDNVFLQKTKNGGDFVKIVDFGVSKFNSLTGGTPMSMTRTGAVVGTPYYMSPEQVKGQKNVDHRSDLYSAGVMLFECVTGQLPFEAESFNELIFKIALEPPLDPEKAVPGLDPNFAKILRRSTAREAADRYQTAADFAQAIAEWMQTANVAVPMGTGANFSASAGFVAPGGSLGGNTPGGAGGTSLPGPAPVFGLDKTTAAGSVINQGTPATAPRRSNGTLAAIAIAAAVVGAATVGLGIARSSKSDNGAAATAAKAPAATEPPAVTTSPLPPAAPAPPVAESAAPTPQASAVASASAAEVPAAPEASAHALVAGHPSLGSPAHHAPAPAAPPVAPGSNSTTIKGRTIRTEL